MAMDGERVYWTTHGYYGSNDPSRGTPVYTTLKSGGKVQTFADNQLIPHCPVVDDKFVYWLTSSSVMKQAKTGGQAEVVYKTDDVEGLDELSQDADSLYFGFRPKGSSRWGLRKVAKAGGEPVTLVKRYSLKPVVVDDTNVYFFDEETSYKDAFCRIPKNGGEVTRLDVGYESGAIAQSKTFVFFGTMDAIFGFQK